MLKCVIIKFFEHVEVVETDMIVMRDSDTRGRQWLGGGAGGRGGRLDSRGLRKFRLHFALPLVCVYSVVY